MLDELNKIALEKFASEEEREAFLEGFMKEASIGRIMAEALSRKSIAKPIGALAVGLGGAALAYGIHSAKSIASNGLLRSKFENSLTQVMNGNKVVRGADPVKAKQYADTIFDFAPHVASDPNLLSSILANAVQGEGVDVMTIKTLTELEGRYRDNNAQKPFLGIK